MAAPINTYNSVTNLSLGNIPQVDDPVIYQALLDVHNALEILVTEVDDVDGIFAAFIAKFRKSTAAVADYTVLPTDGTIEVDASTGDIIITLHPVADGEGHRYDIKRVDVVAANTVTLVGDSAAAELIDNRAAGIKISTGSSYTVKTNEALTGWVII